MRVSCKVQKSASVDALRSASQWLVAASIAAAGFMTVVVRLPVSSDGTDILAWIVAATLIVSLLFHRRRPRLADTFGAVSQVWLGGISSCVVAVAGLRLGMRTSDASLLALDRAIGVDGARVLTWTRHQPDWFVHLLATSYAATVPFAFLSLILLSLVGDRIEVWRAVLCFVGTVLTTCLIAAIVPALGMSAWISPELLDRLSTGAPRHFWPRFQHFHRFHDGTAVVLGLGSIGSCVTFPSFHTIMGLIVAAMWRKRVLVFMPALVWLLLMLFSTMPFGGHYFVDLIGGTAVWAIWFAASQRIERRGWTPLATLPRFRVYRREPSRAGMVGN